MRFCDEIKCNFFKTSYGIKIRHSESTLGQIFRKKNLGFKFLFDPSHREIRQKTSKMAKNGILESFKFKLHLTSPTAYVYEICHKNCVLRYIGGVLELRK